MAPEQDLPPRQVPPRRTPNPDSSTAFEQRGNSLLLLAPLAESQGQNLAVAVLYVPYSLDCGAPRGKDGGQDLPPRQVPPRRTPDPRPSTFNSQPSTLNPQPSTLSPQPSTLNPHPSTLTLHPSPLKCFRAKREQLKRVQDPVPESQGHNLALAVVCVQSPLWTLHLYVPTLYVQ